MNRQILLVCAAVGMLAAAPASAHGIWGHVHVTGWAIENLPPGELRDFFADPEVMNAALFGAAFTDSGYWPQGDGPLAQRARAYSEHTHWEPFIQSFVEWIAANDPPPWDTDESRLRVAFLMGCAAHGLQDEIFDSLFLFQVGEQDGGGQSEADPATDGFLALDAHLRFVPEPYIPMETLLELYEPLNEDIDARTIQSAVDAMVFLYVREGGWVTAEGLGNTYSDAIPWTRAHYLDPDIPGSLRAEIVPTGAYLEALWERLHGDFGPEDTVVSTYPTEPRRLRSHEADTIDSVITYVFGAGVERAGLTSTFVAEDGGAEIAHALEGTRWGNAYPRLVRFDPQEDLVPGGWYVVSLNAGAQLIDGQSVEAPMEFRFQVACTEDTGTCDPIEPFVPDLDGPELPDAGGDASEEVGVDAGADAGDVGEDVGVDASVDATPDVPDTAQPDTDPADAASDTVADTEADDTDGTGDVSGRVSGGNGGCASAPVASAPWALATGLLLGFRRRRR